MPALITTTQALTYLKLEAECAPKTTITEIETLIQAAETYLYNATGIVYKHNALARLFCMMLIADWYDNRQTVGEIGKGARAILSQLKNAHPEDVAAEIPATQKEAAP